MEWVVPRPRSAVGLTPRSAPFNVLGSRATPIAEIARSLALDGQKHSPPTTLREK